MPQPLGLGEIRTMRLSAEHATIELAEPSDTPRTGHRIQMIVGYSDTTVHLHETMVGMRGGRIEQLWRIVGRGRIK
jgi:D-serine deaminase-like pyridoxal phosphate-dependent protein